MIFVNISIFRNEFFGLGDNIDKKKAKVKSRALKNQEGIFKFAGKKEKFHPKYFVVLVPISNCTHSWLHCNLVVLERWRRQIQLETGKIADVCKVISFY